MRENVKRKLDKMLKKLNQKNYVSKEKDLQLKRKQPMMNKNVNEKKLSKHKI